MSASTHTPRFDFVSLGESMLRALRYHALIAEALRLRNAPQARLLMQGHMNSMLDEVLASQARKEAKQNT